MFGMNKYLGNRSREKGFTLVEMAIVLVIIGLIIAAVSIGKDAQRNAEYKKIMNKFVFGWKEAYNQYYERVGYVCHDSGGANAATGNIATADNPMLNTSCGTPTLDGAGVKVPAGTEAGNNYEAIYQYWDQSGNGHRLQLTFINPGTSTTGTALVGNVMQINDITLRLAQMIDLAVDGKASAAEGLFRCSQETNVVSADEVVEDAASMTCDWKMDN
ncbi:MAG: prepilin-type N-terminal cleavage/methylation domain-containing protein [Magnetococcales bacterium]|nr:prepilin-type N-terminal cleavage/methylation domain-containing protein [Magnetococcales bacterium]